MLQIGQRVNGPHGLGTVVRMNETPHNKYFEEKPLEAMAIASQLGAVVLPNGQAVYLAGALTSSVYDGDRYPYVVRFDTGYEDVYAESELEGV